MESVFDDELYDRVLDEETCKRQIELMQTPSIGNLFKETNDAVPRDLNYPDVFFYSGNYQECLSINSVVNGTRIQGKYCQVEVEVPRLPPLRSAPAAPEAPSNQTLRQQVMFAAQRHKLRLVYYIGCEAAIAKTESLDAWTWKPSLRVGVGVCVPHACRATRVWRDVQRAYAGDTGPVLRARGHPLEDPSSEVYCRLPNDITWHYTDSVALVAVCVVVILVASGTALDIRQRRGAAGGEAAGPGRGECALGAWSALRNGHQLAAEATADGGVRCVHGVRALSVIGVVLCHTLLDDVVVENFVIHDQAE
ncbi:hypothetical protein JYU34_009334 [Plutella xylostella]|uniref:Nose resistant-to-fluoxetine protein N-terminal domain-containing protein n=1 Tax=Plutella xylostella TaxID=51655 RepID=A0ABQ7QJE2_PLUXY|nr:hypothetical protein JYU34_009334 [Plutella xylostella]